MRMRTKLLLALLSVSFGLTAAILFILRTSLQSQIRERLASDLASSVDTFHNLQIARQEMLLHDTALLADLPTLKALMTSADSRTIREGGEEFWNVSQSDLFALADPSGKTAAVYNKGKPIDEETAGSALQKAIEGGREPRYVGLDGRLYEISIQPLYFGPVSSGTRLGYVISGYEINSQVAREVSQAAAAEVIFCMDGAIAASTFDAAHRANLSGLLPSLSRTIESRRDVWLGREYFLAAAGSAQHTAAAPVVVWLGREYFLAAAVPISGNSPRVELLVLKSYDQASLFLRRLNRLIVLLGSFVLLAGGVLAVYLARTITRPLESLAGEALAFGSGEFSRVIRHEGAKEIHDLGLAFDRMRLQLRQTQQELLEAERLATIGRMASSISHDLRHHLSAVYANAEFLGYSSSHDKDRAELLGEIRMAVQEMTEMIESLLMFSRTGRALHVSSDFFPHLLERAVALVRSHPDAAGVRIQINVSYQGEAWIDAKKIERAIYNLVLNACQAAGHSMGQPTVILSLIDEGASLRLRIEDNGPGVPDSIRLTLFDPFVSAGKQNGIGLGLTLAQRVAQEHSGHVTLEDSGPNGSVFTFSIAKDCRPSADNNEAEDPAGKWIGAAQPERPMRAQSREEVL